MDVDARVGGHPCGEVAKEAADAVEPDHRPARGVPIAAPIADQHHIVAEHPAEVVDLAERTRRHEGVHQVVAPSGGRLEPLTLLPNGAARPRRDLPARFLTALDHRRDGRVRLGEHVGQEEHRALDGAQPLEYRKEADGERLGQLGSERWVAIGEDRFREPRPHVLLALALRRLQPVEREPRRDGGEPCGRPRHPGLPIGTQAVPPQPCVLHHV